MNIYQIRRIWRSHSLEGYIKQGLAFQALVGGGLDCEGGGWEAKGLIACEDGEDEHRR